MSKKSKKKSKKQKKEESKVFKHPLKLRIASMVDFLQIEKYEGKKKVWGIIKGKPYWCLNSKGVIENKNYILDEYTDLEQFKLLLIHEQVLIPSNSYKN